MLIQSIACIWSCRISTGREDIQVLDYRDDIRCVTSSCTFGMIRMYRPVFEGLDGRFNKARLVQCICVNETLDILLITH